MIFHIEISSIIVYRSKMEVKTLTTRVKTLTTRVAIVNAPLTLAVPYCVK